MTKKKNEKPITVGFVSLGCPKNLVDSEKMLAQIGEAGLVLAGDPDNASVVVINTCGFIAPAKAEAVDAIRLACKQKKKGKVKKVIVTGCLAQRMGEDLLNEVEGIDAIVGLGERDKIAEVIKDAMSCSDKHLYLADAENAISDDSGRLLITPQHRAYLRISEGCNRKCAFCTIPAIRGPFRSKPQDQIIAEATELVESGVNEISIIAQDSNFYGRDLGIKNGLANLIKELEKIDGLKWLRLMYLYPAAVDDELIETIANSKKTLNYIDMPIQHINDEILKSMKRVDRKATTTELVEKLRKAMPDVVLRTTIIVGLPGETDEKFQELLDFVKWAKFDALGCFTFYPEKDTPAAEMQNQVPEEVKAERADQLMLAQQEIAFAKNESRIDSELVCIVEEPADDNGVGLGRYYGQAPQIDSVCYVTNCNAEPGEFINTKVVEVQDYDLIVEQI
jgi:ribosomal protein S12 methylthiotransferase